ncbi:glutathione peroxidase [Desertibaculum subflavum]|uniref:glutathione peroxidase n=1 Tax=Desertibaculum subflavum TaxID=2268458 RepID=UPI000E66AF5F
MFRKLVLALALVLLNTQGHAMSAWDFTFDSIDGKPLSLSDYKGKALLVVNTASQCGFTPQYKGLQALWSHYRDKGLVVLGVPSNDFGGQEPGTAAEIKQFCEVNFDVDFPLTAKQKVVGGEAHPFYRWIAAEFGEGAAPRWNFHKYLIDASGQMVGAYPSRVAPESEEMRKAIEAALPQ